MARSLFALIVLVAGSLCAGQAVAQANRTFVSGQGVDTGGCSLATPCRTFAYAIGQTNAGGEITILDSAGYGAVTITKAIGIIDDSAGEAGVTLLPADTSAITINAGPGDVVVLRGLTLVGGGLTGGGSGITFNSGQTLIVQKSSIRGFSGDGIKYVPSTNPSSLIVTDTEIVDDAVGLYIGPVASSDSGISAVISRSVLSANTDHGFDLDGTVAGGGILRATLSDSVVAQNNFGIAVSSSEGHAQAHLMVKNSVVVNNTQDGIIVSNTNDIEAAGTVRITRTTITGNGTGLANGNGEILSYGDNNIDDDLGGDTAPLTIPEK
jgi:hypothetical protein